MALTNAERQRRFRARRTVRSLHALADRHDELAEEARQGATMFGNETYLRRRALELRELAAERLRDVT